MYEPIESLQLFLVYKQHYNLLGAFLDIGWTVIALIYSYIYTIKIHYHHSKNDSQAEILPSR